MKLRLLFYSIFTLALVSPASAQVLLGGGPMYGDDIEELGVNLRAYTFINERICFGPEFTLFGNHDTVIGGEEAELGLWEVNLNGHFIFEAGESLGIYPVAGFNYSRERERVEAHEDLIEDAFGINLGLGLHYEVNNMVLYTEYDRLFSDLRQNSFTIGVLFHLGKKHKAEEED